MIIVIYSLLLFIIFVKSRSIKDTSLRKIAIWSYNYLVAFIIYLILSFLKDSAIDTKQSILNILDSFYMASKGVAFDRSFQNYRDIFYMLGDERAVEIQIWTIFLIASLSTTFILVTMLFEKKISEFKLLLKYQRQKEKIIIVGNNKNAISLIQNILNTEKHKKTIIKYYTNGKIEDSNSKNIIVKNLNDILKENPYIKCKENHKYSIVLMLNNKNENIEWLGKLTKPVNDSAIKNNTPDTPNTLGPANIQTDYSNIKMTVLCNNEQLRFNIWPGKELDIYLVSEEQLVIDKLMAKNSPLISLKDNKEFISDNGFNYVKNGYSTCIIGFGDLGEEILLSVYENSRFINKSMQENPFKALVIDKRMKELKENFLNDVPYFKTNDYIDFIDTEIGTKDFYDVIKNRLTHIHQIFISTGDNTVNIQTALKILSLIRQEIGTSIESTAIPKIILFIRGENYMLEPLIESSKGILDIINVCENVYTYDNIISRDGDLLAKEVHEDYIKNQDKADGWNKLDNFKKDSNRAVVRDIPNKLALVNKSNKFSQDLERLRALNMDDDLCNKLAVYEHYRWCAFHFAHGWTRLNKEDLTEEEGKDGNNRRNNSQKKHLCLVTWEELTDLPCQKNKYDFQNNDYESVTNLFRKKEVS